MLTNLWKKCNILDVPGKNNGINNGKTIEKRGSKMEDKFNLQVPLMKEVELKLRYKAEQLGMNLTQYTRFIIMQDVLNVVVPGDYEPKKSNRKPPNVKKKTGAAKVTPVVESESDTVKKQIPTNQENKIKITKSSKINRFGGR